MNAINRELQRYKRPEEYAEDSCIHYLQFLFVTYLQALLEVEGAAILENLLPVTSYSRRVSDLKVPIVAFSKCQRKKKNLPASPVLVPMFIKPF